MSIYKNIFHYYRGQTRKGSEETKHLQIENNTTKAFINVLQHSSPVLTNNLIKWIGMEGSENDSFDYMYQVANELHRQTQLAFVLGIAETNQVVHNPQAKRYYIPDGAILSDSVSILIETKIGLNSYLEFNQLEGHKSRFAVNQKVEETIILTWGKIRNFFLEQQGYFIEVNDILTSFLLRQFEEFCVINCIGNPKTNDYFFLRFEKVKAQELARKVHDYIWSESGYKDLQDAETSNGIGYKIIGKQKFATLTTQRKRCLILHIGEKEQRLGLKFQEEIDNVLAKQFNRSNTDNNLYPHEAYIRLEWVDEFEQIQPYIDLAYLLR